MRLGVTCAPFWEGLTKHLPHRPSPCKAPANHQAARDAGERRSTEVLGAGAGGNFEGPGGCLYDNYFTCGGGRWIGFGHALMGATGHG